MERIPLIDWTNTRNDYKSIRMTRMKIIQRRWVPYKKVNVFSFAFLFLFLIDRAFTFTSKYYSSTTQIMTQITLTPKLHKSHPSYQRLNLVDKLAIRKPRDCSLVAVYTPLQKLNLHDVVGFLESLESLDGLLLAECTALSVADLAVDSFDNGSESGRIVLE